MLKIILGIVVIIPLVGGLVYVITNTQRLDFETVCEKGHKNYTKLCKNVGKRAHSHASMSAINPKDYGPILGIAWRRKGSIISSRGREKRYSEQNAYYYIIGSDHSDYTFLRLTSQTEAK